MGSDGPVTTEAQKTKRIPQVAQRVVWTQSVQARPHLGANRTGGIEKQRLRGDKTGAKTKFHHRR